MIESGPHLLRLVALPAFAWAAWSDYHTRRVDPRVWPLLIIIGISASIWQITQLAPLRTVGELNTIIRIVMIPPVIGAIAAGVYNLGHLGGADLKAVFTASLLFPAAIAYPLPFTEATLPLFESPFQSAAISIVMNAMVLGVFYPVVMWYRNLKHGDLSLAAIGSETRDSEELEHTAGQLKIETGGDTQILDLDTLRMYLRWRGLSIQTLRERGHELKDPQSISKTYEVDDGAIQSKWDSGHLMATSHFDAGESTDLVEEQNHHSNTGDDPWGANQFFESLDHDAYGMTPTDLQRGLDYIVENDSVRVIPAVPLVVPLFGGILITITVGDLAMAWVYWMF